MTTHKPIIPQLFPNPRKIAVFRDFPQMGKSLQNIVMKSARRIISVIMEEDNYVRKYRELKCVRVPAGVTTYSESSGERTVPWNI
ncbi:hypothetical protein KQX54_012260 [Cotesia glomerata]|uniref:Uncharacterized protein n=1 Tax=Cotesia glomerata TaxID=32391 RepID=A0AAV7IP17_COTGL|nr:hypothetical protein KQX54_012260 [Cotesia glomerata]